MTGPTDSREPRPNAGRGAAALVVSAVGTIALTALTLGKIPLSDWNRVPATPFDLTSAGEAVQVHLFLSQAADHLPIETTVAITCVPRDPARAERLFSYARALLPGRRLVSDPAVADETVVFGGRSVSADGGSSEAPARHLLFETPYGSVWANPEDGAPRTKH